MKISNPTPNFINQAYGNQANNPVSQGLKSQKNGDETYTDRINLSDRIKDLHKVSKAMENEPEGRKKYVSDIKQQVETNQYNINAETIAKKMAGSLMNEIG